jgi:hypothetical protein
VGVCWRYFIVFDALARRVLKIIHCEILSGGWVQNDEANPSLYGIVNQMTSGHEYLLQNFGIQPRIAWQLDPFGHSSVSPTLFALMGFDALVINRIHFSEKDNLKSKNFMEFIWRGANVGVNVDMLTHVLHTHYSAPKYVTLCTFLCFLSSLFRP